MQSSRHGAQELSRLKEEDVSGIYYESNTKESIPLSSDLSEDISTKDDRGARIHTQMRDRSTCPRYISASLLDSRLETSSIIPPCLPCIRANHIYSLPVIFRELRDFLIGYSARQQYPVACTSLADERAASGLRESVFDKLASN